MANYLKVNSQDHAVQKTGSLKCAQEPSRFNHPFESVPAVLPEFLKCCRITVGPLSTSVVSGKRPKSWVSGKGQRNVSLSWMQCSCPGQNGVLWDWASVAPLLIHTCKVIDPSGHLFKTPEAGGWEKLSTPHRQRSRVPKATGELAPLF